MVMISDLTSDLVEEILSKTPITSLGEVRSTCKRWNALSKEKRITKKHCDNSPEEFLVIMAWVDSFWTLSRRLNLHKIEDLPSINEVGTVFCPEEISQVYPCNGLLLCVTKDNSRLAVWNPYLAQTRWIQIREYLHRECKYAIGYENNNNHKILRIFCTYAEIEKFEIYDFKSNSWSVLGITNQMCTFHRGVSLKGNTYFIDREMWEDGWVICFDFTTERFGPRMNLPFHTAIGDCVVPSCVREEQLAVLHQTYGTCELEIWITTKIEPNAVSWSKFFKVDMAPLADSDILSKFQVKSFFIDKEKKLAVVCGRRTCESYVFGEDGYYTRIGVKEDVFSYVPSLVPVDPAMQGPSTSKKKTWR